MSQWHWTLSRSLLILHLILGWSLYLDCGLRLRCVHRRLADGDVHCAGRSTYQICFRLPIPNPNLITDPNPNPKINKKQNDTGMKLNIRNGKRNTYGYSRLLVVLSINQSIYYQLCTVRQLRKKMHSDELPVKQCLSMLAAHNENKLSICRLTNEEQK